MSLLIDIDQKNGIFLRPIVKEMCREFSALDEKEMLVIIYTYDHYSIYRQYNERSRIAYAISKVYDDNNPKLLAALEEKPPHHRITNAVEAYKSLQHDPKIELMNSFQRTIDDLQSEINSALSDRELESKLNSIGKLRKSFLELEKEVIMGLMEQGQVKGDKALSYLEQIQKNRQLYNDTIKRKAK